MSLLIPFDFTRDLLNPLDFSDFDDYLWPLFIVPHSMRRLQNNVRKGVKRNADGFKLQVDCTHFKPEELSVKTVDGELIVHGKHEERPDEHGYVKREFTRRYTIPEGVETEHMNSSLDSEGTLTITAPRKKLKTESNERVIPITMGNALRIGNSNSKKNDGQKEGK
ncbi:hypothetical protein B4U79_14046 [Dinothrombium tinctorium]|uniref:SHSP domain-containing protein n=1 Tax=Dinothrombium tinctorium TaxID=1965070 RepID=A0A443R4J3_9ACAR|nr:hypothetical protein B4U79_14046 [Dinothrombium tinctorium]